MDLGASVILGLMIVLLIILVVSVVVIIYYLIKISREIKSITESTNQSMKSIMEFSDLIKTISVPLAILSTLSSMLIKFNKAKRKRGKKDVKK